MAAFDVSLVASALVSRGLDLASLGAAYLAAIVNLLAAGALFLVARSTLVITPNRAARSYGVYGALVLTALLIATVLENELAAASATLRYAAVPQLLLLLGVHVAASRSAEPRLIAAAGAASVGGLVTLALAALAFGAVAPAYLLAAVTVAGLLAFLWINSVSTKRAFRTASSIYTKSKERAEQPTEPQRPWLGLGQWVALGGASVVLAAFNSLLRGYGIAEIPAVQVLIESALLLGVTVVVCAVPAGLYWTARRAWMPELTRFAWLVWIVVSFSFTYGNYLTSLDKV